MNRFVVFVATVVLFVVGIEAFPDYVNYIPNGILLRFLVLLLLLINVIFFCKGNRIPNPCDRRKFWDAIGHENVLGGGKTTIFGDLFPGVSSFFIPFRYN